MKVYIAHSYKHRQELKEVLDALETTVRSNGDTPFFFTRTYTTFGKGEEKAMMTAALAELRSSDLLIAELSTKEVGVGLEIGFAAALELPIIYIRRDGTEVSTTVSGVATHVLTYSSPGDLSAQILEILVKK